MAFCTVFRSVSVQTLDGPNPSAVMPFCSSVWNVAGGVSWNISDVQHSGRICKTASRHLRLTDGKVASIAEAGNGFSGRNEFLFLLLS